MKDGFVTRKLNSVGKKIFVTYFNLFFDYSRKSISKEDAIFKLVDDGVSNDAGASIRLGNAKSIFDGKGEKEALEIIIESKRVDFKTREVASQILLNYS